MPTIVYLIHGMGCGTADGSAQPAGKDWESEAIAAFKWLCAAYGLATPSVVHPSDTKAPQNPAGLSDANAIWVAPLSYYSIFDEFRKSSTDREKLVKGITQALSDAYITKLTKEDFLWANCLDVLLWWADQVQTHNRTTATLGQGITAINELASVPGATTRRIIVSHSLGTAATTAVLLDLATKPVWRNNTGFEAWFTLANVAPFVLEQAQVYDKSLLPDGDLSVIHSYMYNARNECDPIPWLLWWRAFDPKHAGGMANAWTSAQTNGLYEELDTRAVAGLQGSTPTIMGVHGFTNYMLSPDVAVALAGHVRGKMFSPAERLAIDYDSKWNGLPHLACTKDTTAFNRLRDAVKQYQNNGPTQAGGNAKVDWITRLIDGAEMLLSYEKQC